MIFPDVLIKYTVILVGLILGAVFGFYAAALYVYAVIVDPIHAGALFGSVKKFVSLEENDSFLVRITI